MTSGRCVGWNLFQQPRRRWFWLSLMVVVLAHEAEPSPLIQRFTPVSLKPVSETLSNTSDPNHDWVKSLYGRIIRIYDGRGGSGTIVGRAPNGQSVFLTARHILLNEYP